MRRDRVDGSRRAFLAAGALGAAGALAGCAVYGRPQAASPPPVAPSAPASPAAAAEADEEPQPRQSEAAPPEEREEPAQSAGTRIARTADVPVGGGYLATEHNVVVTQPTSGQFRAFSAVCTHAGCPVTSVSGGTINCDCHGSRFSVVDGSVQGGPAPAPLPEVAITVNGDSIEI